MYGSSQKPLTIVLSLETSCDETAVALVDGSSVLANIVASQVRSHAPYGGVVPELASRKHVELLPYLVTRAFAEAGIGWSAVTAVAATVAPGLVGALLVGLTTAKTLALLHGKHFLAVHHLEGHLCSVQLSGAPLPEGPYLVLLVSGGHTQLVRVDGPGVYHLCGATVDDAVGEAFDKVARLLGLGYPGGPAVQAAALSGDPRRFALPEGRVSRPGGGYEPYAFSFSGLKTAVLRLVQALKQQGDAPLPVADVAASFERTVANVLSERSVRCAKDQRLNHLMLVGGVAANRRLRRHMQEKCTAAGLNLSLVPLAFCGDNAAMIGVAACQHLARGCRSAMDIGVSSRLGLEAVDRLYEAVAPF